MKPKNSTTNALAILDRIIGDETEVRSMIEEERVNVLVARAIYSLRIARGLSQQALAERVGTTQSVVSRLEDSDYEGHSLRMLRRIADALDATVAVSLIPNEALSAPGE